MKKLLSNKWTWVIAGILIISAFLIIRNVRKKKADANKKSGGSRLSQIDKKVSQAPKMTRAVTVSAPPTITN